MKEEEEEELALALIFDSRFSLSQCHVMCHVHTLKTKKTLSLLYVDLHLFLLN